MCLENTSEYKSAAAEQRRYRAALISALVKPAAILKLFAPCVSRLSYLPLFFFSNILPYPPPPPNTTTPSLSLESQGSSSSLFSSAVSLRVQ